MKYNVTYRGNSSKFKTFETEVNADTEREAVEKVYGEYLDSNYFPQDDGSIKDCDGNTIAEADDTTIEYDGGCFSAEEMEECFK
jgi:hypothetical protein